MNLSLVLFQQSLLSLTILDVSDQLPGPTLVYHDGTREDDVSEVARRLASNRGVLIASMRPRLKPELPSPLNLHLPHSTVLIGSDPEAMFKSLRMWRLWDARDPVLVVLSAGEDPNIWLSAAWRIARGVNVAVAVLETPVQFFTWFPYRWRNCTNVSTISRLSQKLLFPPKVPEDLKGCPLTAVTTGLKPVVVDDTHGIEPRIVITIAKKLNMRLQYVRLPKNIYVWNYFDKSGIPIDAMKLLWENQVDILFCNAHLRLEPSLWAEFLPAHLEDQLLWFVPGPRVISRATTVFRAFSIQAWAFVLTSSIVIFISAASLPFLETGHPTAALMRTIALNLNLPTELPPSRVLRIFMIATYIYSLHITTAYQSSLIVFLADVPREPTIKTTDDLADSEYPIQFSESQRSIIESIKEPYMLRLTQQERCEWVLTLWLYGVPKRKIALLGPKMAFSYFIDLNYQNRFRDGYGYPLALTLKEIFSTTPLTMYMSLGHPLLPLFRRYTKYLFEGGFPNEFLRIETQKAAPTSRSKEPFGLDNVQGVFDLYLGLLALSLFVFVSELLLACCLRHGRRKGQTVKRPEGTTDDRRPRDVPSHRLQILNWWIDKK